MQLFSFANNPLLCGPGTTKPCPGDPPFSPPPPFNPPTPLSPQGDNLLSHHWIMHIYHAYESNFSLANFGRLFAYSCIVDTVNTITPYSRSVVQLSLTRQNIAS